MRIVLIVATALLLPFANSGGQDPDPTPAQVAQGQQVFELVCSGCHTLDPPPDSAPPMRHVARHLRQDLETFVELAEQVRTYVREPDAERSLLPPRAVERFGVMPALPLTDDILTAAAAYIWSLSEAGPMGMGGPGMRRGGGFAP